MESTSFLFVFRETAPERYEAMSAPERRDALVAWNAWCEKLAGEGILESGHPLMPEGRLVGGSGSGRTARPLDGPFAEAKELIGGYFFIRAADLDEATAIAQGSPNIPHGQSVEVRPVTEACHLARSLGMRSNRDPLPA